MDRARGSHDPGWKLPERVAVVPAGMGSFDCAAVRFASGNFAQDDRFIRGRGIRTKRSVRTKREHTNEMDFEVNGETYFVNLGENRGWEVCVSTPTGARTIPVYEDAPDDEDVTFVVEDERKRRIPN